MLQIFITIVLLALVCILVFSVYKHAYYTSTGIDGLPPPYWARGVQPAQVPAPSTPGLPAESLEPSSSQVQTPNVSVGYTGDLAPIILGIFAIITVFVVIYCIMWLLSFFQLECKLQDLRDDVLKRGAYAYDLPGAAGVCRLHLAALWFIIQTTPARFCVLHDEERKIVQRILFNTSENFPYKMIFDYNNNYRLGTPYDFKGCVYLELTRRERKKLAKYMCRSAYDAEEVQAALNEFYCLAEFSDVVVNEACTASAVIKDAMKKQGETYSRMLSRKRSKE